MQAADFSEPRHPLLALPDELERATRALAQAYRDEAEAENKLLRAHSVAYLSASVAATVRSKWADAQPRVVEARCSLNLAAAARKEHAAKCSELEARLNAAQSWARLAGRAD